MKKVFKKNYFKFILLSFLSFYTSNVLAQSEEGVVIDKIIAKVDNLIILKSELERSYLDVLSRGQIRNASLKCQILQQLVVNKMLVAKAELDSIIVTENEVNNNLDRRMSVMAQQFGGEEEIEKSYNKSIEQIRDEIFQDIKEQLTIQKMQSELTSDMKVSPSEVARFFKDIPRDSLPYFSSEVSIAQIVREIKAGSPRKNEAKKTLLELRSRILNGESFESLAKQYSQDPGSGSRGGELGFFGRGELAPEFEAAALEMNPGELSMPIETQFGMHLIQLQERRGNIYKSRHILLIPTPNENDYKKTETFLDSLRTSIIDDSITFQAAAKEHSDDQETASAGGFFQDETGALRVSSDQLDPNIFFTVDTMEIGEITKPLLFQQQDGTYAYRIIFFKDRVKPHQANLKDDYQKIAMAALNQKQNMVISEWFDSAKQNVFISIDPEYNQCNLSNY